MWAVNKNPAVWGVSISTRGCSMIKAPGLRPRAQLASLFCPQGVGGCGQFLMLPFRRACHTVGLGMVRRVEQFRFKAGSWYAKIHVGT